jgi:hypothetical protein
MKMIASLFAWFKAWRAARKATAAQNMFDAGYKYAMDELTSGSTVQDLEDMIYDPWWKDENDGPDHFVAGAYSAIADWEKSNKSLSEIIERLS